MVVDVAAVTVAVATVVVVMKRYINTTFYMNVLCIIIFNEF